jgi:hypothetical protein
VPQRGQIGSARLDGGAVCGVGRAVVVVIVNVFAVHGSSFERATEVIDVVVITGQRVDLGVVDGGERRVDQKTSSEELKK